MSDHQAFRLRQYLVDVSSMRLHLSNSRRICPGQGVTSGRVDV